MHMRLRFLPVIALCAAALASCEHVRSVETPLRSEQISVYTSENPDVMINNIQVPFTGTDNGEIHILTDVQYSLDYLVDPSLSSVDSDWFRIKEVKDIASNHKVVVYEASSLLESNNLGRRSGTMSLMCPSIYFGKILAVRQGYTVTYDVGFDGAAGSSLSLSGNMAYTTSALNSCNLHYYDYISFNAYAATEYDPAGVIITIDVQIAEGAPHFDANGAKSIRLNVPVGTQAGSENLHYLLISNGGDRIGGGMKLRFSTQNPEGTTVHFENLRVYKVSEAELEDLVDDEEDYDSDKENW